MITVIANTIVMALNGYDIYTNNIKDFEQYVANFLIFRANLIFTYIFIAEMAIKIMALGSLGYVRDVMNCFDGLIVIMSIIDISKIFI